MQAQSGRKGTPESMQSTIDQAKDRGEELLNTADSKARQMTDNAMSELSSLASNLNSRLKDLGIDTAKVAESAKEGAASIETKLSDELVAHPLRSLAIAAGIGLVLGAMSRK